MKIILILLLILLPSTRGEGAPKGRMRGLILVGERVEFQNTVPQFSPEQTRRISKATRDGLSQWAATEQGRRLISRFDRDDYQILVVEDGEERGMGRAPQPAIGTMTSADNHTRLKIYRVILNPARAEVPDVGTPIFREPTTPAELMAAAWAGEMLHIYFYSQGVVLPHHEREDFQRHWREVAEQLGFANLRHDHR